MLKSNSHIFLFNTSGNRSYSITLKTIMHFSVIIAALAVLAYTSAGAQLGDTSISTATIGSGISATASEIGGLYSTTIFDIASAFSTETSLLGGAISTALAEASTRISSLNSAASMETGPAKSSLLSEASSLSRAASAAVSILKSTASQNGTSTSSSFTERPVPIWGSVIVGAVMGAVLM